MAFRGKIIKKKPPPEKKRCLRCDQLFQPPHRGLFICKQCKKVDAFKFM